MHCSSRVSSISTTRSAVLATSARRALVNVVLPVEVPPATRMFLRCSDRAPQGLSLLRGHDAGGDVVVEREDGDRWLADSKGRRRDHRRQQTFESLSGLGQFSGNARRTSMHFGADVVRHQPNDAFSVGGREALACVRQAARQPVDPQPAIGVEHHLDDRGVLQVSRNGGAKRAAEHARAARDRLCLSRMNCHRRPQQRGRLRSALRWG